MRTRSTAVAILKKSNKILGREGGAASPIAIAVAAALAAVQAPATGLTLFAALGTTIATATEARSSTYNLDIPAQNLNDALQALALASQHKLLYSSGLVDGKSAPALKGEFTTEEAVRQLLTGTGLVYEVADGLVLIRAKDAKLTVNSIGKLDGEGHLGGNSQRCSGLSSNKLDSVTSLNQTTSDSTAIGWTALEGGSDCSSENSQRNQRLASADAGVAGEPVQNSDGESSLEKDSTHQGKLEEIVVTAQKKTESLMDVPVPVTVISAVSLTEANQTGLQDYFSRLPGVSMTSSLGGGPAIFIRGITTGGFGNPTVGTAVDDVPYGTSTALGGGYQTPDFDPSDLARIEVLRGPQGTLYGASSMGGLLKYVTIDPSTDGVGGRFQVGTESIHNGDGLGYNVRGALNLPLGDALAVRASAFKRHDAGYVDDISHDIRGINHGDAYGGLMSALWRPSQDFSLKLSAMLQDSKTHATNDIVGDHLGQLNYIPGHGGWDTRDWFVNATLLAKLGTADLTSVSGYSDGEFHNRANLIPDSWISGTAFPYDFGNSHHKFSQEVRLSTPLGKHFDWLVGAFYTDEDSLGHEAGSIADFYSGAVAGTVFDVGYPVTYKEYAAFTDLTLHVTDRFEVQVGGRQSYNKQTYRDVSYFPTFSTSPEQETKADAFTYLLTPSLKLSPDLMVYARLASGFRAGGPNYNAALVGAPPKFEPDMTNNYEIGAKGELFSQNLSFDISVYYIDWKDIQIRQYFTGSDGIDRAFVFNAGKAKSQGVELSLSSRPLTGLTIAGWVAWNAAELTEDFSSSSTQYGKAGDRLPYSAHWSGNVSLTQDFPLTNLITGFVEASVNYLGERKGDFPTSPMRAHLPAYTRADIRGGVNFGPWSVDAFVNNLTDERGALSLTSETPNASSPYTIIQPRTVGINVSREF